MIYLQCGKIENLKAMPLDLHEDDKIQRIAAITCVCEDAKLCPKLEGKLTTDRVCFLFYAPAELREKMTIVLPKSEKEVIQ